MQDTDGDLRDTSEPDRPHLGQLPDMAALRGGEALHRLLQHQQRQVPALPDTPQECQGEQGAAGPEQGPLQPGNSTYPCACVTQILTIHPQIEHPSPF